MPTLFDPVDLGAVRAPNRILMAPLTRGRSTKEHVPTPLMAEYYSQRASAGLIISEATGISRQGLGWAYAPGLWTDEQTAAWKPIVAAVHKAGGRFFAQLWHMGRIVHPDFLGGAKGVSASATAAPGEIRTYEARSRIKRRARWSSARSPACSRITAARRGMRWRRDSTACSFMPRTAI
jgi:2,4-dienoyl-CoA reductase-like NADH-dependent reductase (Old Yellow Enzyme family)